MAGTQYQELLGAIDNYYGAGSDQWAKIAQYGIAADGAEQILSQVPGVDVLKNNAGQITGYTYSSPFPVSDAGNVAGELDSNLQLPVYANGGSGASGANQVNYTFNAPIPANAPANGGTGNIDFGSGAKRLSDNSTVSSVLTRVTPAIQAVSMGARAGANIAQRFYNANPDYWDEKLPTLNPQTWDSIAGKNKLGKTVINTIFGIDKRNNKTTMYIPEDAAAYMMYAMYKEKFFADGSEEMTEAPAGMNLQTPIRRTKFTPAEDTQILPHSMPIGTYARGISRVYTSNPPVGDIYVTGIEGINRYVAACANSGNSMGYCYFTSSGEYDGGSGAGAMGRYAYAEKSVYYSSNGFNNPTSFFIPTSANQPSGLWWNVAWAMIHGQFVKNDPPEGVERQPSATLPDTSTWNNPADTLASLRTQHPEWWDDAIYTDVAQQDGTTTRIVYIPAPITETTSATQTDPTNTTVTQTDTGDVTDDSIKSLINTVIRYLTQTQSETPEDTPNPPDVPNPPDTGNGSTPTPVLPMGQASSLWAVYNPTQAEINSFGAWLWSQNFVDQLLKLFNDPMQAIIGLHKIFATPPISGTRNIVVGYLDSGVSANAVSAQYTDVNCGSVRLREYFGNVFDYIETQIRLYLPFIGIVPLDTSDVMRSIISVVYHVDVITGACLADVNVSRDGGGGVLYQFSGDAAVRYPISSGSYMGMVSGVLGIVGGIASGIASGGAMLPLAAGAVMQGMSGAHTQVQHSGNFSGAAGAMGIKKPYLIIERPQSAIAESYANYQGNGENNVKTVGDMSGYFRMTDVKLNSVQGASDSELETIRALLEQGVIA